MGFNGKSVSAQQASTTSSPYIVSLSFLFLSPRSGPSRPGYKMLLVPSYLSPPPFPTPFALFQPILRARPRSLYLALPFPLVFSLGRTSLVQTCRFTVTLVSSSLFNSSCTIRTPTPFISFLPSVSLAPTVSHGSCKARSANSEIFEACTRNGASWWRAFAAGLIFVVNHETGTGVSHSSPAALQSDKIV